MSAPRPAPLILAAVVFLAAPHARASQWLKLTGPAAGSTLPLLAQTVTFQYTIDVHGFRQHTKDFKSTIGVWITVCTGGCAASGDMIDSRELGPSEQTTTTLAVSKIKQHLTQHSLPLSTPIKWNLMFHLPGTFHDQSERETDSTFFVGHLEAAGGGPTVVRTPTPAPSQKPPR